MLSDMCPNTQSLWETTLLQSPSPLVLFVRQLKPSPFGEIMNNVLLSYNLQFYLKHPNKEGLATVVNDERPPGVPLTGVLYHPVHHGGSVKPQTINLNEYKRPLVSIFWIIDN